MVEILLPVHDNQGRPFEESMFTRVREELTDRFGGATAFTRAPAQGTFDDRGQVQRDDIVIFEVMTPTLDRRWWASYRERLQQHFAQDEIVIRCMRIERL